MFRLLGILTLGHLLTGGRHHHRAIRRGLLFGALLGYLANRDFDADRVRREAREAARKAERAARRASRAIREEFRDARRAEHDRRTADHLNAIHAEADARRAAREARRAERGGERAETAEPIYALPVSGVNEAEEIRELVGDLERNAEGTAVAADVPTIDFPEEDEKYHTARKYGYA